MATLKFSSIPEIVRQQGFHESQERDKMGEETIPPMDLVCIGARIGLQRYRSL